MAKILSLIIGFVVFLSVTGWLDQYVFWVIAVVGGAIAGVFTYDIMMRFLGGLHHDS